MRARVSLHTHGRCARERVLTHTGGRTAAGRAAYLKCITCTTSPVPRLQSSRRFLLGVWPEPSSLSCPCPCPCPCDRPSTFACSPPLLSCPFSVCAVKAALSPPTASFPLIIFRSTPSLRPTLETVLVFLNDLVINLVESPQRSTRKEGYGPYGAKTL